MVGTKGRSLGGFQGLLPGSVSKYCLQHSPVPVIVVRPSSKRDKSRVKRAQDPSRQTYKDLLEKSGPQGGHIVSNRNSFILEEDTIPASDDEAAAVAAAIGYKPQHEPSPLAQVQAVPRELNPRASTSSLGGDPDSNLGDDLRSPGVVMKSPHLGNLDSPEISDSSSSSDEEDEGGIPTSNTPSTTAPESRSEEKQVDKDLPIP